MGAKNQKRRRHYLVEPGWRADNAIQGLGRSHRAAQACAPFFRVCTTDVHGEKRFTSTIARRLDTLGALTKGERKTASQGMFRAEDNLESPIARACLRALYCSFVAGDAEYITYEAFCDWTGLQLTDKDGILLDDLPPIQRFLNRILALPIAMQNAIFADFMERISDASERAMAAGTVDKGLEHIKADQIELVGTERLRRCDITGAETSLAELRLTRKKSWTTAAKAQELFTSGRLAPMQNQTSGQIALVTKLAMQVMENDGSLVFEHKLHRPKGVSWITADKLAKSSWSEIPLEALLRLWQQEVDALPETEISNLFLLTGLILPIWNDIPSNETRIMRCTPQGFCGCRP